MVNAISPVPMDPSRYIIGDRRKRAEAHCVTAVNKADKGGYNEAIKEFNEALRIDADCVDAHNGLATIYLNHNDYLKASMEAEKVLRLDKRNAQAHITLGTCKYYLTINDTNATFETAINDLKTALHNDPYDVYANYTMSCIYVELFKRDHKEDNWKIAERYATVAVQKGPRSVDAHFLLGVIYAHYAQKHGGSFWRVLANREFMKVQVLKPGRAIPVF